MDQLVAHIYALVKTGIVENVIVADSDFILGIQNQYDNIVEILPEQHRPQIGWSYDGTSFLDPANSLESLKSRKLVEFNEAMQSYTRSRYTTVTQIKFVNLYIAAKSDGQANRAAYLKPVLDWINSLTIYEARVINELQNQITILDVINYSWNIEANTLADPGLRLIDAALILD